MGLIQNFSQQGGGEGEEKGPLNPKTLCQIMYI